MHTNQSEAMDLRRITGVIGAEISGLDLRGELSDAVREKLRMALAEHQVLFFRNQDLNEDQQISVSGIFAQPVVNIVARRFGITKQLSVIEDDGLHRPDRDSWHSDVTFADNPPSIAVLKAVVIPPYGGDTMWASLYGAYDALSPTMQAFVDTLDVVHFTGHDMIELIRKRQGEEAATRMQTTFGDMAHPLVLRHPLTGRKALFISERFTKKIVGLTDQESEALLFYLHRLIDNPDLQVRWKWQQNDIAIWDERTTNHRGLTDHFPQHRIIVRCEGEGDPPSSWRLRPRPSPTSVQSVGDRVRVPVV